MKKNLYFSLLFVFGLFLFPFHVQAAENYSIQANIEDEGTVSASLTLKLNGMQEYQEGNTLNYFVKFVNQDDEKPTDGTYENLVQNANTERDDITRWKSVLYNSTANSGNIQMSEDWYLLEGYDYAYVAECNYDSSVKSCTVTEQAIPVEKPTLPEYGKRYDSFVFSGYYQNGGTYDDSSISLFSNFPHMGTNGSHQYVVKFGKITDITIIDKFASNANDANESLLSYAQNAKDQTYTFSDNQTEYDITAFKPDFNAYYYFYVTYENSDGLYRDLSDVYIGKFGSGGVLARYTDFDSTDSLEMMSTTVENPNTSDKNIIMYIGLLILVSIGIAFSYRKLKKLQ